MVCCGSSDSFSTKSTTQITDSSTEIERIGSQSNETSSDLLPDRSSCGFQVDYKR